MSIRAFCLTLAFAAACTSSGAKATAPAASAPEPKAESGSSAAPARDLDPKAPVARVGGKAITAAELDDSVKGELRRAENEYRERVYQIRSQGLEQMINKRLLEAKAKGKNPDDFLKKELASDVTEPTQQEMQALYDRAKASGQQVPPFEQVKDQISRYLKEERSRNASTKYYAKLKDEAKVETLLPAYTPPRVEVAAIGPSKGPEKAPITIVEFSDFQCPFCSRAESTVNQVLEQYKDKIRLVYRDFPLPGHPMAQKASEASLCAQDQGKYWEMHDKLFANQQKLEVPALKGYAKELGLNTSKFDKCLDSGDKAKVIDASKQAGAEAGVSGTPAFFVNGMMINGALPIENFKTLIDAELARK